MDPNDSLLCVGVLRFLLVFVLHVKGGVSSDILPTSDDGGFSVRHGNQCCRSLKALSEPLNVSGRVLIAVHDEPTGGADMGTHREALLHPFPTAATVLAGIGRFYHDNSLPGAFCLESEDSPELRPSSVRDGLGQVVIPNHVGNLQVFYVDHIVAAYQHERSLMVKVSSLPLNVLMLPLQQLQCFLPALASLLPARHPPLRLGKLLLGFAVVARVLDSAEECLEGMVQAAQDILYDLRMYFTIFGTGPFQVRQFRLLLIVVGTFTLAALPPGATLLQSNIVERATAPQDDFQRLGLFWRWFEAILERLASCLTHGLLALLAFDVACQGF
jgi:hypothetical protein